MFYIIEILNAHPFGDLYAFSIELLWSTFIPTQDSPIDLMLKGDNQEQSRMFNI